MSAGCPTLAELPAPPPGRPGWPWTEQTPRRAEVALCPRVTLVTPSYNQAPYLEETIRSVLLQGYPNLEYIVMDGGSTDGSVEILGKYERFLSHWSSCADKGQSDALAKGFGMATGELMGWINSDDFLTPGAVRMAVEAWLDSGRPTILSGWVQLFEDGPTRRLTTLAQPHFTFESLARPWLLRPFGFHQPGSLFRRDTYEAAGGVNVQLHSAMDYDLYARMLAVDDRVAHVPRTLAWFREHAVSKTTGAGETSIHHLQEHRQATRGLQDQLTPGERQRLREYYAERAWYNLVGAAVARRHGDVRASLGFALELGVTASLVGAFRLGCRGLRKSVSGEGVALRHGR